MKKFVPILVVCGLFCSTNYASSTDNNWHHSDYVRADNESLYNFVQSCCSYYMGAAFARSSSSDRNALYDRIINECVKTHNISTTAFHKKHVELSVYNWLTDFAGRKAYQWATQQGADADYAKTFADQVKKDINSHITDIYHDSNAFSSPQNSPMLPEKFFEPYLAQPPATYTRHENSRTKDAQENTTRLWNNLIKSFADFFYSDEYNQKWPEATPANTINPPATLLTTQSENNKTSNKLFPTQECSANCFTNFKDDHADRIFLPCGHNFCIDCLKNWIYGNGHSTCPQCRHDLEILQRARIYEVLYASSVYCSCCNSSEATLKTLTCKHKLCNACLKKWRSTPFGNTCPRCSHTIKNLE